MRFVAKLNWQPLLLLLAGFGYFALESRAQLASLPDRMLVPLVMTRKDVESKLGPGSGDCRCVYETRSETVTVRYSEHSCDGGWSTPIETVLRFEAKPKKAFKLNSLDLDLGAFVRTNDDAMYSSYTNATEGLIIRASPDDIVENIEYVPTNMEGNRLGVRCSGYGSYSVFSRVYPIAFSYEMQGWPLDLPEIDNMLNVARARRDTTLYFVVYFTGGTQPRTKIRYLKALSARVRSSLGKAYSQSSVIDGGQRPRSMTEVFYIVKGLPAPIPEPRPHH